MFTENTIEITIQVPVMTAEYVLMELRQKTRSLMTKYDFTYGWSSVSIPCMGGEIMVQVDIDDREMNVTYLVAGNPDFETEYRKLNYLEAMRQLRNLLESEIVF